MTGMEHWIYFDSLFFRLFDPAIPWYVVAAVVVAASGVHLWLWRAGRGRTVVPWIVACVFLMLYTTVLRRLVAHPDGLRLDLVPLHSIEYIRNGYVETFYEKLYNMILFMPYGVLLAVHTRLKGLQWGRRLALSTLVGFGTSVGIELLQLVTRTGTCETDDVICNTAGCVAGAFVVFVTWMVFRVFSDFVIPGIFRNKHE